MGKTLRVTLGTIYHLTLRDSRTGEILDERHMTANEYEKWLEPELSWLSWAEEEEFQSVCRKGYSP